MANLSNINGKFVVEQTTGYVGVGTTDPNYPIEVLNASAEIALNASGGSIYRVQSDSASNFIIRKAGVGDRLIINSAGATTFSSSIDAGGRIKVSGGNTDQYYFEGARNGVGVTYRLYDNANNIYHDSWSSQVIRLNQNGGSGGNLIISGGNVGIGTTSPYAQLHVSHSLGNGGIMLGNTATTGSKEMLLNIHPLGLIWQRWVNGAYQANLMTLDYDGNLGIGTTSPGNKLTIASGTGGGSAPDSRTLLHIDKDGEAYISINSPAESFNGIRLNVAGSPKAFMELYDNTAQGKKLNIGTIDARDLVFDTGNQPRMTILSGGNVGIGVTSTNDINEGKLYVNGTLSLDQTSEIKYGKNNGGPYLNTRSKDGTTSACGIRIHSPVGSPGYLYGEGSGTSGTSIMILDGAGQSVFSATQGNNTQLRVNNQTHLYIDNSGNVGIGTTLPDSLLTVSGSSLQNSNNAGIELSNSHNAQTVLLIENTTSRKYEVAVGGSANSIGNGSFYIYDGTAGAARLVINSSGNVGIGGTPSTFANFTNVTIQGGSSGSNLDFKNSSGTRVSAIVSTPSLLSIETNTTTPIIFKTNDTERMRITSAGGISFGSSGTAYGTSGQVLTSNGNATPTWQAAGGSAWPQEKFAEYTIDSTTSNILVATLNSTTWHGNYLAGCLKFTFSTSDYIQVTYLPVSTFLSAGNKLFFKGTEMTTKNNGTNPARITITFAGNNGTYGSTCTVKLNRNQSELSYTKVNVLIQAISNPNMFILN